MSTSLETTQTAATDTYATLVQLYINEGAYAWNRYNVMLVAQSVLLATVGVLLTGSLLQMTLILVLAGLMLCVLWYAVTDAGFRMCRYYQLCAIEFEKKHFALSDQVFVKTTEMEQSRRLLRLLGIQRAATAAIGVFSLIYLLLLGTVLFRF